MSMSNSVSISVSVSVSVSISVSVSVSDSVSVSVSVYAIWILISNVALLNRRRGYHLWKFQRNPNHCHSLSRKLNDNFSEMNCWSDTSLELQNITRMEQEENISNFQHLSTKRNCFLKLQNIHYWCKFWSLSKYLIYVCHLSPSFTMPSKKTSNLQILLLRRKLYYHCPDTQTLSQITYLALVPTPKLQVLSSTLLQNYFQQCYWHHFQHQ